MLSDIGGEIVRLLYTHDSVVVEYLVRAHVQSPWVKRTPTRARCCRSRTFPCDHARPSGWREASMAYRLTYWRRPQTRRNVC